VILVPILALVIGAIAAMLLQIRAPGVIGQYLAVASLAGLDTVLGGIRSAYENNFQDDVFITGFFANTLIALLIAWLGDWIGLNLYLVATLVLGMRIFNNLSLIRRFLLVQYKDLMKKRREQRAANQVQLVAEEAE
jgi:small basic protein